MSEKTLPPRHGGYRAVTTKSPSGSTSSLTGSAARPAPPRPPAGQGGGSQLNTNRAS